MMTLLPESVVGTMVNMVAVVNGEIYHNCIIYVKSDLQKSH